MTATEPSPATYRIGVDVGGTFTDVVAIRSDGVVVLEKTPTTPRDQSDGVLDGIGRIATAEGFESTDAVLARTTSIVHGTTTGDNTMIQMSGAPTGLLVTAGFRDEIEMRRCYKEDIWDPALGPPEPIAKRRVRLEIAERMTAEGEIDTPLDEDEVRRAVRRLHAFGVTSIAICFLHSYLNPVHELRARDLVLEEYPDVELVSLSHEVYPKPPEFERTSTTLVNAYVGPPIVRYLGRLEQRLNDAGYAGELLIATSSGGVATPDAIGRLAVATIGSGPTGGVVAASRASVDAELGDVVSVDMGGTSYDVCLIRGGRPELNSDWNWRHRYCIALPMVDIHAIGAGGGSIVHFDGVALQVGPESAGSEPGPACYDRGGTVATITDANLVLGRLDPDTFWSGRARLDATKARAALEAAGRPLGLDAEATAIAAVRIVDAHMTDAVRRVLSSAGVDPRRVDLCAFGGMGALHATAQGAALGVRQVLVPRAAPGFSALGLVSADHLVDISRGLIANWREVDVAALDALARELEANAREQLDRADVPRDRQVLQFALNLVYPGQTFDHAIPLSFSSTNPLTVEDIEACVETFHKENEAARLIEARAQEPMVRGVRLTATGLVDRPRAAHFPPVDELPPVKARRRVHTGVEWSDAVAVYDAAALSPGPTLEGPAVIEYPFTTLLLRPGDSATMRENGDVIVAIA
jgi:N-methylhydantoinase A